MNKVKFFLFAAVAMFATSCATDSVDEPQATDVAATTSAKIINTSANAMNGELLIYVDEETVEALNGAECATRTGVSELDAIAQSIGASSVEQLFNMKMNAERKKEMGLDRWFIVTFPEDVNLDVAAKQLASVPAINAVQFNTLVSKPDVQMAGYANPTKFENTRASEYPFDDPMFTGQWHYHNTAQPGVSDKIIAGSDINLLRAWEYTTGRNDIIVAVLDEGIDYTHADLKDNIWTNDAELNGVEGVDDDNNGYVDDIYGWNFALNSPLLSWSRDGDVGHATHVGGTIAAVNNNGIGVAGVAGGSGKNDGVRLMSCQIFSGEDAATVAQTGRAIEYAADNGACLANNSWGVPAAEGPRSDSEFMSYCAAEFDAYAYFAKTKNCAALDGGLAIFAAGNDSYTHASYPGAYNEYISVTALACDGFPTWYTNYGPGANVATYGGEIEFGNDDPSQVLSTVPKSLYGYEYGYMQGTSMACPHATGMAALALSYALDNNLTFSLSEFKTRFLSSVVDINSKLTGQREYVYGWMKLDNYKNNMGTGSLDAYLLLMNMRGEVCLPAVVGEEVEIRVADYLGTGEGYLTLLREVEISDADMARLGITSKPDIFNGKLCIKCTKPGCGRIKLAFVAGGSSVGGGESMGGMRIEKEFAIIARSANDESMGWL